MSYENAEVTFDSIPWPPRYEGLLLHVKGLAEEAGVEGETLAEDKAWRKAREEAMLRYHPDKFMQKYGAYIVDDEERERIEQNVNLIC